MLRKLSCLERVVADQKFDFLSKVLALKEQERAYCLTYIMAAPVAYVRKWWESNLAFKEHERAYNCTCKGLCNINHKIYNWKRSTSDEMVSKCWQTIKHLHQNFLLRKLSCLEKVVAEQKFDFLSKVLPLKEHEKAHKCTCKGVCNINHKIHNWTRYKSDEILSKSENAEDEKLKQMKFGQREIINQYCKNPWGLHFFDLIGL